MKVMTIRSPQVAAFLLRNECRIIRIKPDPNNSLKTFFVFELTDKLSSLLKEYSEGKPGKGGGDK